MHPFYILVGHGGLRTPVQVEGKMHTECWIQQVTTRVGAVTCWIQQSVSPKQVVGFTFVFNSEIDQLTRKSSVQRFAHAQEDHKRSREKSKSITTNVQSTHFQFIEKSENYVPSHFQFMSFPIHFISNSCRNPWHCFMAPFLLANFLATLYFVPYLYGGRSPPYK